jgi:hypothetical protein
MADFWTNCQANSEVCMTAILVGVVVTLLILFLYTKYSGGTFLGMEHMNEHVQNQIQQNMMMARGLGLSSEQMKAKNYR